MAAAKYNQYTGILVDNSDVKAEVLTTVVGEHNTINVHPPPPQTKQSSGIIFNVQESVHSFTGREDIISQLHKKIEENKQSSTPTVVTQSATICGMGGVGKTETVRKYIQTYGNTYKNVIWVNAESYSEAKSCFIHLADRLCVQSTLSNGIAKEDHLFAEEIYSKLTDPTLVVFDNVQREKDDNKGNVGLFFPKTILGKKIHWAIILTTRERNYNDQPKIDLIGLSHEECYELLICSPQIDRSEKNHHAALKIQELCEGLPIVVHQVIAIVKKNNSQQFLSQKKYSLSDYVTSVHANLIELTKAMPADSPVGKSVYTIFQLTFKKLQNSESGRTALYCLDVMSLLNPENIPVPLLKHLVTDTSEDEFSTSILLLIEHNLITEQNQLLKIHRMIQTIRRQDGHFLNKVDLKQNIFSSCISKLFGMGKNSPTNILCLFSQFMDKIALNDEHIHQILDNGIRLQMICKGLINVDTNEQYTFADTLRNKLTNVGRYNEAEELCHVTLRQREKLLGKNHPDTLSLKYNLASVYADQGKCNQAEELSQVVLGEQEKLLGKSHPGTLNTKQILAKVYRTQGKYDKAEELYQNVLKEQEQLLGKSHPDTLSTKHNLAIVYQQQSKYNMAEEFYKVALQGLEKLLGKNHPDTLHSKIGLAAMYQNQRKYDQAEELYQIVLQEQEKLLGKSHPHTLGTKHNLAIVYQLQRKYNLAEEFYKVTLQEREKLLGKNHPDTLQSKRGLAIVYRNQGKYDRAEKLYQVVLQEQEKLLGKIHPDTLGTKHSLAIVYQYQGKYNQAEELHQVVLQEREKLLGKSHHDTLHSKLGLATVYQNQGMYDRVEELYQVVLQEQEKILGKSHPSTLITKHNLAIVYQLQSKYNLAEELYKVALPEREKLVGKNHPGTLNSKHGLAIVNRNQGMYDRVEELYQVVLQEQEKILGKSHPSTLITKRNLAKLHQNHGK